MARKVQPETVAVNNDKPAAYLNFRIRTKDGRSKALGKFGLGLFASNKLDANLIKHLRENEDAVANLLDALTVTFHEVGSEDEEIEFDF